jgi:small subunit ribosomal protein S16
LQRKGKKGQPYYHIVIADGRAPRDGRFIEKIGTYNPLTKPADIDFDFTRALYWLQSGAQPTDTVRAIFSYKGVLYKNHLQKGVTKGALTQEQADAKFDAWLKDKEEKIAGKVKEVETESREDKKKRLEAEKKVNEARAKELAAKRLAELKAEEAEKGGETEEVAVAGAVVAEEVAEVVAEVAEVAEEVAEAVEEAAEEEVVAEEGAKAEAEAIVEEAKEEATMEEEVKAEEPAEEVVEAKEEETEATEEEKKKEE